MERAYTQRLRVTGTIQRMAAARSGTFLQIFVSHNYSAKVMCLKNAKNYAYNLDL